jgi:hypothetical protein
MTPEVLNASEPEPKGMGEFSRLTGVFFEPGKTFEDIAARPRFWVPLILAILVGCVVVGLFSQHVGWDRMMKQQFDMNPQMQQMSADQREKALEFWSKFGSVMGYGFALIGTPLTFLILAAVFLGMSKGIMSAPITFKQSMAAVSYGWMPNVIGGILTIVVMFLKSPDDFRLDNPLVFNAGAFMDPVSSNKFLLSIAASFDLIWLWSLFLMATGLKAAGGKKLSMGGAMTAVFGPWLLWVLAKSALAGLRG